MARWRRLTSIAGVAAGVAAASAGAVIAAEKIAIGRIRLQPDPAAGEPFWQRGGSSVTVLANDGVPLSAEISGSDDAEVTVVLCHGYALSQEVWHYQTEALAEVARVVTWDQRSHGRSGRSDPDRVSIEQLGADLAAVVAATVPGDRPVVLVGHSMGGMTIMALAVQHPELFGTKIIGVGLIATAASGVDPTGWLPSPLRPVGRVAGASIMAGSGGGPRRAALTDRVRRTATDLAFLSTRYVAFGDDSVSPAVVDFLERIIRRTPTEVLAQFFPVLLKHEKRAALAIIGQVPTVVLTGAKDRLISSKLTAELAAQIPGATLITLPEAGHALQLEQPVIVTDAIEDLMAKALSGAEQRRRLA
jgi:pimeloyl-ACP methyl ester carboxylesterase